ncbi:MAG: amidohydrolase family protein [Chthoniobacter sp.]|uniref:amidohydrolase family protein n=1 Tax=Chthoniobacter sp. TaxID=2510640 RepID=UPI0032AC256D
MRDSSITLPRRDFLRGALAAGLLTGTRIHAAQTAERRTSLIDTNAWLDQWPVRRLTLETPAALAAKLTQNGVTRAWVSSFDGMLHKDIGGVNARLAETGQRFPIFEPIGIVNLSLPRWEADVAACATQHRMRGLRLLPGYHGYKLDDPRFAELLKLAGSHRLAVQIVVSLEDERTQNPLLRVPPVDIAPLPRALEATPGARVMILNWPHVAAGKPVLLTLQKTGVYLDIAMIEGIAGLEATLAELPVDRLCFGSYAPVFYFESAKLKLRESELTDAQLDAITQANAQRFLGA